MALEQKNSTLQRGTGGDISTNTKKLVSINKSGIFHPEDNSLLDDAKTFTTPLDNKDIQALGEMGKTPNKNVLPGNNHNISDINSKGVISNPQQVIKNPKDNVQKLIQKPNEIKKPIDAIKKPIDTIDAIKKPIDKINAIKKPPTIKKPIADKVKSLPQQVNVKSNLLDFPLPEIPKPMVSPETTIHLNNGEMFGGHSELDLDVGTDVNTNLTGQGNQFEGTFSKIQKDRIKTLQKEIPALKKSELEKTKEKLKPKEELKNVPFMDGWNVGEKDLGKEGVGVTYTADLKGNAPSIGKNNFFSDVRPDKSNFGQNNLTSDFIKPSTNIGQNNLTSDFNKPSTNVGQNNLESNFVNPSTNIGQNNLTSDFSKPNTVFGQNNLGSNFNTPTKYKP